MNKIIGLKTAAFAFAAMMAVYSVGLTGILGTLTGLVIFAILFAVESGAMELYTKNKMTMEVEIEPQPVKSSP